MARPDKIKDIMGKYLKAYYENKGHRRKAEEASGIHRDVVNIWLMKNKEFRKEIDIINENIADDVVARLHMMIDKGNYYAIKLFLESKAGFKDSRPDDTEWKLEIVERIIEKDHEQKRNS
jgi:hypothetical protein